MVVSKFKTRLNELLSKESIQESDYLMYIKTLAALNQSIQYGHWFHTYGPVVKDWISEFQTIFSGNKVDGDLPILDKLCTATTEVFLGLLQSFHQFDPKYSQEFYSHWKSVILRINESERASTFIRHIGQFKVVIEHLRTAEHRCEQLAILSVLKLYIGSVPKDQLKKLIVHDNSEIVEKLIELMKNPTVTNQNEFLHEIDAMGHCIVSMEPLKIVCDKLKMQYNSSEHKMWIDFNLKEKSVIFVTISLINTENRTLAVGDHIKMRQNDENMVEINGTWNILTNNKEPYQKRVTIIIFLSDNNLIPESVKNVFRFIHSAFVGSISQVMTERQPSPNNTIDDGNIETQSKISQREDSIASISSMVPSIQIFGNLKPLTQTVRQEVQKENDDFQELFNSGRNVAEKVDIIAAERLTDQSSSIALAISVNPIALEQLHNDRNKEDIFDKGEEVTPVECVNETMKKSVDDECGKNLVVNKATSDISIEREDDRSSGMSFRDEYMSDVEYKNSGDSESEIETSESENEDGYSNIFWKKFGGNVRLTRERQFNKTFVIPNSPTERNETFLPSVTKRTVKYMHSSQIDMQLPLKQMRHLDIYSQPTTSRELFSIKASPMEQITTKKNENVYVKELPPEKSPIKSHNPNEMIDQSIAYVQGPRKRLMTPEQQNVSQKKMKFFNRSNGMSQEPKPQEVSQAYEMFVSPAMPTQAIRQRFTQQRSEKNNELSKTAALSQQSQNSANSLQHQAENFVSLPASNETSHESSLMRLQEETTKTAPDETNQGSEERSNLPTASRRVTRDSTKYPSKASSYVPPTMHSSQIDMQPSLEYAGHLDIYSQPTTSLEQSLIKVSPMEKTSPTGSENVYVQELPAGKSSTETSPIKNHSQNRNEMINQSIKPVQDPRNRSMTPELRNVSQKKLKVFNRSNEMYPTPQTQEISQNPYEMFEPLATSTQVSGHKFTQQQSQKGNIASLPVYSQNSSRKSTLICLQEETTAPVKGNQYAQEISNLPIVSRRVTRNSTKQLSKDNSYVPPMMHSSQIAVQLSPEYVLDLDIYSQPATSRERSLVKVPSMDQILPKESENVYLQDFSAKKFSIETSYNRNEMIDQPIEPIQDPRIKANSETSLQDQAENFVSLPVSSQISHKKETTKAAPAKTNQESKERSNLPTVSRRATRNSRKQLSDGSASITPGRKIQPSQKASSSTTQNSSKGLEESFILPLIQNISPNQIDESVDPPTVSSWAKRNSTKQPVMVSSSMIKIQQPEKISSSPIPNSSEILQESFLLPSFLPNLPQNQIVKSVIPPIVATQASQKSSTLKQQPVQIVQQPQKILNLSTVSSRVASKTLSSKKSLKRAIVKADSVLPRVATRKAINSTKQNSMKNRIETFVPEVEECQTENENIGMSNGTEKTYKSLRKTSTSSKRGSSQHLVKSFFSEDVLPETGQGLMTSNNSWKVESWIESLPTYASQKTSKNRPQEKSSKTIGLTNAEPFKASNDIHSTMGSINTNNNHYNMPDHNETVTGDNVQIDEAGMINDEKGCVFANYDELQRATNVFLEKEGLAYMKTQAFKALNVKTREKIERQFRTIHTMMNRGLNNLHRNDDMSFDNDPYVPGHSEAIVQTFRKPKLKMKLTEEVSVTLSKQKNNGKTVNSQKVSFAITHRRVSKIYQVNDDDTTSTSTLPSQMLPKRKNNSPVPTYEKKFFKKKKYFHVKEPTYKEGTVSRNKANITMIETPVRETPIYASEKMKALHRERQMACSTEGTRYVNMDCADPTVNDPMGVSNENRIDELPTGMKITHRNRDIVSSTKKFSPSSANNCPIVEDLSPNVSTGNGAIGVYGDNSKKKLSDESATKKTKNRKLKVSSSTDVYLDYGDPKVDESSTNVPSGDGPIVNENRIEELPSKIMKTTNRKQEILSSKIDRPSKDLNVNCYDLTDFDTNAPLTDDPMAPINEIRVEKVPTDTSARLTTTNRKPKISSLIDEKRDPLSVDIDCPDPKTGDVENSPSTSNAINENKRCDMVSCDANMKVVISGINESLKYPLEMCERHRTIVTDFIESVQHVDLQRNSVVVNGLTGIINATMESIQSLCDNAVAQCEAIENNLK